MRLLILNVFSFPTPRSLIICFPLIPFFLKDLYTITMPLPIFRPFLFLYQMRKAKLYPRKNGKRRCLKLFFEHTNMTQMLEILIISPVLATSLIYL